MGLPPPVGVTCAKTEAPERSSSLPPPHTHQRGSHCQAVLFSEQHFSLTSTADSQYAMPAEIQVISFGHMGIVACKTLVSVYVWDCQQIHETSQGGRLTVIVMVPIGLDPSEG